MQEDAATAVHRPEVLLAAARPARGEADALARLRDGLEAALSRCLGAPAAVTLAVEALSETGLARERRVAALAGAGAAVAWVTPGLLASPGALAVLARFAPGQVVALAPRGALALRKTLPRCLLGARWVDWPSEAGGPAQAGETRALARAAALLAGALEAPGGPGEGPLGARLLEVQQAARRARAEARTLSPARLDAVEARARAERAVEANLEIGRRAVQAEVRRRTDPANWTDRGRPRFPRVGQGEIPLVVMALLIFGAVLSPFFLYFGVVWAFTA